MPLAAEWTHVWYHTLTHVWYHTLTATVCPCECMSAKSRIELHSSSSEEESTEQDPTGNLGERFRLLVRQVLRKAPLLFSSRMREISCETQNGASWGNNNWTTRNIQPKHVFIVTHKGAGSRDNLEFAQNKWISSKKYASPKCFRQQEMKIFQPSTVSTTSIRSACTAREIENSRGSFSSPSSICRCVC